MTFLLPLSRNLDNTIDQLKQIKEKLGVNSKQQKDKNKNLFL